MMLLPTISALAVFLPSIVTGRPTDVTTQARETLEEAAVHARELIKYRSDGLGTLMSVFPTDYEDPSLAGLAIGLQEYTAVNEEGDIYLLAMPISRVFHNALLLPSHNATLTIKDEKAEREKGKMWAANRRRVAMWGTLTRLSGDEAKVAKACYEEEHPDSPYWDGVDGPHFSYWVKFSVYKIYYFGGFGDRNAIGFLDMDLYRSSIPEAPKDESALINPIEELVETIGSLDQAVKRPRKGLGFRVQE